MCYYIYGGVIMIEVKGDLKTFYMLIVVWLLSLLFSAVMFTVSLMYDSFATIIVSGITGVLSCIGVFYTGYEVIRIKQRINIEESK